MSVETEIYSMAGFAIDDLKDVTLQPEVCDATVNMPAQTVPEKADALLKPGVPKILVVDDEPLNVELLEAHLSVADYEVVTAYCGEEALEKIESEKPDLILLDAMMPDLNGFDISRMLKENEETMFIPIVMITALSELEDKLRSIESGADEFLTKPVNSLELTTRVKSLLRVKRRHDEAEAKAARIKVEKEIVKQELEMAQRIQCTLLPDVCPTMDGLELAALTLPAGDVRTNFYDFIPVSRDKLGLVVAHFSGGSGVPGVLFMALSRALVRANAGSNPTVSDAIYQANDLITNNKLIHGESGISGSLFYALIDFKERNITYVKDETSESIVVDGADNDLVLLGANGTQFGALNASATEESCITLSTGDTVVLCTSGVVNAVNGAGEEFGRHRMVRIMENNQDSSAHDLIQKIKEKLLLFVDHTPMCEDTTLIALKDNGAGEILLDAKGVSDYVALLNKHNNSSHQVAVRNICDKGITSRI